MHYALCTLHIYRWYAIKVNKLREVVQHEREKGTRVNMST